MNDVYDYKNILGHNTKEHYVETVIDKPKRYIAEQILNGKESSKISVRKMNEILKNQKFKYATTNVQYYHQTKRLSNYKIDSLLRILDVFDLELVIRPKTK